MTHPNTSSNDRSFTDIVADADRSAQERQTQAARDAEPALPGSVERDMSAIEIVVRWGDNVLAAEHLDPPRSYHLGEAEDCDFTVGANLLGASKLALIEVRDGCVVEAVIPIGARASVAMADEEPSLLETAAVTPRKIALQPAQRVRIALGELSFEIRGVASATRGKLGFRLSKRGALGTLLSAALHIGLLAATAAFVPPMGFDDDTIVTDEQHYVMKQYLTAAAEMERESLASDSHSDGLAGGEDSDGSEDESNPGGGNDYTGGPLATGPQAGPPVYISAQDALEDARNFGFVELLRAHDNGNVPVFGAELSDTPSSPWATGMWDSADPVSSMMMLELSNPNGDNSSSPNGWYRVRLSDIGPGGPGTRDGFSRRQLRKKHTHVAVAPNVRTSTPSVSDSAIPAAVIQRIVRANHGRFRACYESGLRTNPSLQGRVVVNFVIGHDGTVRGVNGGGSDLADSSVISCVTGSFRGLTFPAPESGIVTVTYPIALMPIGA